ncbi:MAG: serine/threonine-protein phosphatase [Bacteroidales bacterium]|nr:serine/threonine-protein phosphatase [Bacteroidales bacterium]
MSDITFKMTVATNVGLVRSNNEDNFIVNPDLTQPGRWIVPANADEVLSLGENGCVMVVADGMGGMNAGEVASEIAVTHVQNAFSKVSDFSKIADCSNHVEAFLKKIIVEADAAIKKRVKEDPSTAGMGTTIVMAWIIGEVVHVAWCGDSRAYLFNRQSGLSRLSNDHSYVQELVDSGKLDPELAFDHPNSNIITRSLGDSPVKAQPDYVCRRLSAGDYVILCTDGLCGLVRDEQILNIMMQERGRLADYKEALFNASFEEGAYDNVTIALFECMSVKEQNLASTVSPTESGRKKKNEKREETETGTKVSKPKSAGKKFLSFLIVVLVLAGIVAAACHFGFITVDANKNIQINVSGVDSLIRSSVEKLENKTVIEDTATVITEHIDSTAQ